MRPRPRDAPGAALAAPAELNCTGDTGHGARQQLQGSLSSTIALTVVLLLLLALLVTSLLTYCFHKWKLRGKRLQKAQEEYQRDQEKSICQSTPGLVS